MCTRHVTWPAMPRSPAAKPTAPEERGKSEMAKFRLWDSGLLPAPALQPFPSKLIGQKTLSAFHSLWRDCCLLSFKKKKKDGLHTHEGDFLQRRIVSVGKDVEL